MFNENLSSLRRKSGLTQEALAERLGVSRQAVARWEAGETSPDVNVLQKLCELFGVSADGILSGDSEAAAFEPSVFKLPAEAEEAFAAVPEEPDQKAKRRGRALAVAAAALALLTVASNGAMICLTLSQNRNAGGVSPASESGGENPLRSLSFTQNGTTHTSDVGGAVGQLEFWDAESYREWIEKEIEHFQSLADRGEEWKWTAESGEEKRIWTQDTVDRIKKSMQEQLEAIEAGDLYVKDYSVGWVDENGEYFVIEADDSFAHGGEVYSETYVFTATDAVVTTADGFEDESELVKMFEPLKKFGLEFKEEDGGRNLYYNGRAVGKFIDIKPDGGVFVFDSDGGGDLILRTVYDENGRLTGVK